MKQGTRKFLSLILPVLALLGACSGGTTDQDSVEAINPAQNVVNTDPLIANWANFIGIDPAEAREDLEKIGIMEKLGKGSLLDESEFRSYLSLVFEKDLTWQSDTRALNRANQNVVSSFRGFRADAQSKQESLEEYQAMTQQARALRLRAELGAQILGFFLQPTGSTDLLEDENFSPIRNVYIQPLISRLFDSVNGSLSPDQEDIIAQLLTTVTFRVEGKFLSFYNFTALSPEEAERLNSPIPIVRIARGAFQIFEAGDNPFLDIPVGNDRQWGNPGGGYYGDGRGRGDYYGGRHPWHP